MRDFFRARSEKLTAASAAFDPPLSTALLRQGLCTGYLRQRKAAESVEWCDKAHRASPDDLSIAYQLADAKTCAARAGRRGAPAVHPRCRRGAGAVHPRVAHGPSAPHAHRHTHTCGRARLRTPPPCTLRSKSLRLARQQLAPPLWSSARRLNGEEHAALQLLRTLQRRFPRNPELHNKVNQLDQRIKNQAKVNYYKVLGVPRAASSRDVKKAYHKLAKTYHPDKVEREEDKAAASEKFRKIARAYEVRAPLGSPRPALHAPPGAASPARRWIQACMHDLLALDSGMHA